MPQPPLTSVEHLPQAVVIHLLAQNLGKSEVDAVCDGVDEALSVAAAAGTPSLPFILDMGTVSFAGSLAMGTLVGLNQEFRTRGQRLIFVAWQPLVLQAITMTRISRLMEFQPDVPTALQLISSQKSEARTSE